MVTSTTPDDEPSLEQRVSDLTEEARDIRHGQRRRDVLIGVLSVLTLVLIVMVSVMTARLNDVHTVVNDLHATSQSNHDLQDEIARNTNTIKDCTQPTGSCFRAGQQRTQRLVDGAVVGIAGAMHRTVCSLLTDLDAGGLISAQSLTNARAREHC